MKIVFTITCFILLAYCSVAQDTTGKQSCLIAGGFCNFKLCDTCTLPSVFNLVSEDTGISYAKNPLPGTYPGDVIYKDENLAPSTSPADCRHEELSGYASCSGSTDILRYNVYYPSGYTKSQYLKCPLPAVIFVHGGGFSDCKVAEENAPSATGIAFAQRGFVFYDVEYRTGVRLVPKDFGTDRNGNFYVSVQQQLAEYRASQDVRGAIRSIIQRQRDQAFLSNVQKLPYQIDTSNIFLAGASAGSITVLNVAYYPTQNMINQINPNSGTVRIEDALGKINADYYYGDTSIDYSSNIKGVLAQWGSLALPPTYTPSTAKNFFTQRIPIICFHGLQDNVVNPDTISVYFAPVDNRIPSIYKDSFNTERTCLVNIPFKAKTNSTSTPSIYTYGSAAYFKYILQPLGIKSELYLDCDAGHGLQNASGSGVFKADYGTHYPTDDAVGLYIIGRAATFFQSIIGNTAQTATSHIRFVECRNNRVTCDMTNNDAGCANNDNCGTHPH